MGLKPLKAWINVLQVFAKKSSLGTNSPQQNNHPMKNNQTENLAKLFRENPNVEFLMPYLHRIGSKSLTGFCCSFTRRISDLRKMGLNIVKTKDEYVDGQRNTAYTNIVT
jgi:hypothetical protein